MVLILILSVLRTDCYWTEAMRQTLTAKIETFQFLLYKASVCEVDNKIWQHIWNAVQHNSGCASLNLNLNEAKNVVGPKGSLGPSDETAQPKMWFSAF